MPEPPAQRITQLLIAWNNGDGSALGRLAPIVHAELRRLAHREMRGERPGHILQTTALINEAYLRLVQCRRVNWRNRSQFFALSAQLMRRILVDAARARGARKRGRASGRLSVAPSAAAASPPAVDVLALHEALSRLAAINPRQSRVVELRYFGGMTVAETADAMQVSVQTVVRDWNFAKLWLLRALKARSRDSRETPDEQRAASADPGRL